MKVVLARDAAQMAWFAARFVARRMVEVMHPVLGLATGETMLSVYSELARLHSEEGLDFSPATTFNLDEYVRLAPEHPASYHSFMREHLVAQVNLDPDRVHLPNGGAPDLLVEAERYEYAIAQAGGITVQLLGIGSNGHIAFNEPGSSLRSRTRVKRLSERTIRDNARFFRSDEDVPRYVLTMGVGTISDARFVLLLASGARKAQAVRAAVEGPLTAQCPASALQLHPHTFVVVDPDAAAGLEGRYETVAEVLADPYEEFIYERE